MPPTRWVPAAVPETAAELVRQGVPRHLAGLLARRGVAGRREADAFFEPSLDQLHDPFELAGVLPATERIAAAHERGERIAVVGDYDVDGVSGTALLLAVLRSCGLEAEPILPHRLKEGYGFQPVHAERARELDCRLIVTVDCGTTSVDAARRAAELGLDVIVSDHHLPGPALPDGVIQINPRQEGCTYPFPDLAGAGIALKLAQAVTRRLDRTVDPRALLRIACLGTIADMVPLLGENRAIAKLGLEALPATPSPGLQALMRQARVRPPLSAADVGFRIGPRINAAGRLDDARSALDLLLCRDPATAGRLAEELDRWNRERQDEEMRVREEARELVLARGADAPAGSAGPDGVAPILVAWSDRWHRGVVGIAAGRLVREFHRPAVLLAVEGGEAVGSGRSVPGIELHAFLEQWRERLLRFGGHSQAVGMAADPDELESLRDAWEASAAEWPAEHLRRRLEFELELAPGELTPELLADLSRLEPFGQANPQPLLRVGPMAITGEPRIFGRTERRHLAAFAAGPDGSTVQILGWGWAARGDELAGTFEALGSLEADRYTGRPVLRLVDARAVDSGRDEGR
jgi:single-stranded-DNA-specific exonuclease